MSQELNLNLENTSWERIDGEIIVISYNTGKYYSVNKQGSDLLHLIEMKVKKDFWYEILKSNFKNFDEDSKTTQIIDEFILKCFNEKLLINGVLNIEKIELKDRTSWIQRLTHTEWTCEELASGEPLQRILKEKVA